MRKKENRNRTLVSFFYKLMRIGHPFALSSVGLFSRWQYPYIVRLILMSAGEDGDTQEWSRVVRDTAPLLIEIADKSKKWLPSYHDISHLLRLVIEGKKWFMREDDKSNKLSREEFETYRQLGGAKLRPWMSEFIKYPDWVYDTHTDVVKSLELGGRWEDRERVKRKYDELGSIRKMWDYFLPLGKELEVLGIRELIGKDKEQVKKEKESEKNKEFGLAKWIG